MTIYNDSDLGAIELPSEAVIAKGVAEGHAAMSEEGKFAELAYCDRLLEDIDTWYGNHEDIQGDGEFSLQYVLSKGANSEEGDYEEDDSE